MNEPLSLRRSSKKFSLLAAAILLILPATGCSLFQNGAKTAEKEKDIPEKTVPPGAVSSARIAARKQSGTFICLIADSGSPFASFDSSKQTWHGIEPQIIREIAKRMKMKVQFIRIPAGNISSALRNGRGDIAAAKLDTGTIKALAFTAVTPYAPAAKGNLAFMVRQDDAQWQKKVSAAAASVNITGIVSGNSSTIGSVRVKLAGDDDKALPVLTGPESKPVKVKPEKPVKKKVKVVPPKPKAAPASPKIKPSKQEKTKK